MIGEARYLSIAPILPIWIIINKKDFCGLIRYQGPHQTHMTKGSQNAFKRLGNHFIWMIFQDPTKLTIQNSSASLKKK